MNAIATPLPRRFAHLYTGFGELVDRLQPIFALAVRLYVARVFFASGLIKIMSWSSTLALFANEFHVPLLSPTMAAYLGTAAELGLPVLLALGLGTRFAALVLFVFNIVAVISYPDLSDAGLKDHMLWGALMLVTFFYGPGKISVDHILQRRAGR
ncbi:MAG TPA: DoxX family protein [Casimicrobiaceae bacterium]|nr:DoxX family protein [Casimicrobiaceae bacterium]